MKKLAAIVGLALTIAVGGVFAEATPYAASTPKAQAYSYTSCYTSINGNRWCWRYACTYFEKLYLPCDQWVIAGNTWYA